MLGEVGATELTTALRGTSARLTSVISRAEVQRAAALRDPAAAERAVEVISRLSLVELDGMVVAQAATLRPATLWALDAIHVASAMRLAESLDAFVTYDPHRAEAARAVGLAVESPGVELGLAPASMSETPFVATAAPVDHVLVQRVVDRLVGRLRPTRIAIPTNREADVVGDLRLVVVLGDWSPGRDAPRQAQESIRDLGVRVELDFLDDDGLVASRLGRVLYEAS